jgi:hypothetical protein
VHKERYTPELDALNTHAAVVEVIATFSEQGLYTFDGLAHKAIIVIAPDKDLMGVGQGNEPLDKVGNLSGGACH